MRRYIVAAIILLLALAPASLEAQTKFSVSGLAGGFIPAGDLFDEVFTAGVLSFGHKASVGLGGRVAVWPSSKIGVESEFVWSPSKVEFASVAPGTGLFEQGDFDANVIAASLNLVVNVFDPPLDPLSVFVSGGLGLVARSGDAFTGFEDDTDIAGVGAVGIRYGVSRNARIRVDVRDYISSFEEKNITRLFEAAGLDVGSKLQNDLVIAAALEYVFGGD